MAKMKKRTMKELIEEYDIDLDAISANIKEIEDNPKSNHLVLLQFPDGMKPFATTVMDYSKKPISLSPSSCIDMQSNPLIIVKSACYNSISKNVEVKLFRNVDNYLINSINIVLGNEGSSHSLSCSSACSTCVIPEAGSTRFYYIASSTKPEAGTLSINNCEVTPIKIDDC